MRKIPILCLLFVVQVNCWKSFHFGRSFGGNLGKPRNNNSVLPEPFPEMWFTQKLDHFNPNNEVTWKQVRILTKSDTSVLQLDIFI